ncbi:MAG: alginate export family protein [Pseudomonadota bacterium]
MNRTLKHTLFTIVLGSTIASASGPASAYNLVDKNGSELNLDLELVLGHFSSEETYGNSNTSPSWSEGYAKYGLSGSQSLSDGAVFGAVNAVSSATWGDGDALGVTNGEERETDVEDLYVGYRHDLFEFSVGRQNITIGDGFILNGDALNLGKGAGPEELNRGGAYWLAARKAFDKTAMLRVGGKDGIRSDVFWFKSDNYAQARPEMTGINLEYVADKGTVALMHLKGLDVDEEWGFANRDGQDTTSLRYQGNAGVENLFLSAEYAHQSQGDSSDNAKAWYVEAGWTFTNLPWSPSLNYRYTSYDENYDSLFFGFNRGYGTWFQGEVAANYAGPFGTDSDIHHLGIKAFPSETLTLGASLFDFSNTAGHTGDNDATEIDLWAEWVAMDHLIISPLIGFYTPDSDTSNQGNDDTNIYAQIIAIVPF